MLNSHTKICVPHELQILFEYSHNGRRLYEVFKNNDNDVFQPNDYIELIKVVCPHKFDEYFDYINFFNKQQYPIKSLKELTNNLYEQIATSFNKEYFFEQTPWYGQRIDILNELFPDAKYIHIVRDGRDVAISFKRTLWWHNDIEQNLERWRVEIQNIIESTKMLLRAGQLLQVRYEDLVDDPRTVLSQICDFIGLSYEKSMLDSTTYIDYGRYRRYDNKDISSSAFNDWYPLRREPVFSGSKYAWHQFSDFDFTTISTGVIDTLTRLGYEINLC
jgi:hypothetical protein